MTYQAPPPPPGGNPPPPPPPPPPGGGYGTPPSGGYGTPGGSGGGSFDPKAVNPLDWAAIAAGVLALIFSFIDFYDVNVGASSSCPAAVRDEVTNANYPSASAWHGFFGWFGVLLALVGALLLAVDLFVPQARMQVAPRLAALGAFALATICEIIAIFVVPGGSYDSGNIGGGVLGNCHVHASVGHGFGFWITLILVIVGTVVTLMRFQQTGGQLPGRLANVPNIGGYGPQGGMAGSQPGYGQSPQPGPGYGPPPQGPPPQPGPGYGPPPQPGPGYGPPPQGPPPQGPPPQGPPPQGYGPPPQ